MQFYNTLIPYKILDYTGIEYNVCKDYNHISRYKGLRQVAHNPDSSTDRFVTLEIPNVFRSNVEVQYYDVKTFEENRLDLIAEEFLGSATYSWVIAYMNNIEDGFRSEEHTSELQSRFDLVCRLLLEKKKNKKNEIKKYILGRYKTHIDNTLQLDSK